MTAYYNEIDPFAAAWLRELIKAGHIAPGEVDTRSIEDVRADDLRGFTQCHFFAGIGVWSYALRCAGWPDDRPVWTGSCPCQPFSAAGKRGGTSDERHLFPAWFHLISVCRPPTVFGEQVASKDGLAWLDLVHADLEGQGYAVGCLDLSAAGFGAPHIRQRLYFVADAQHAQRRPLGGPGENERDRDDRGRQEAHRQPGACGEVRFLADHNEAGRLDQQETRLHGHGASGDDVSGCGVDGELGDTSGRGCGERRDEAQPGSGGHPDGSSELGNTIQPGLEGHAGNGGNGSEPGRQREDASGSVAETGPLNGFWRNAVWLPCRDGKARPTQPGLFPLAHGAPARVGRLRGYGNAIAAPVAKEFIRAYMEVSHD